jgi:hypothetical protein
MRVYRLALAMLPILAAGLDARADGQPCNEGGAGAGELVYRADFEADHDGWTIENTPGTGVGLWSRADFCLANSAPSGGDYVLAFQFLASCNYSVESLGLGFGLPLVGHVTSAPIDLGSADGVTTLVFDYAISTDGAATRDRLTLSASEDGLTFTPIADNRPNTGLPDLCDNNTFTSTWRTAALDVSGFAGKLLYLRFHFDTVTAFANSRPGVAIDDVRVYAAGTAEGTLEEGEGGVEGSIEGEDPGTTLAPANIDFDFFMRGLETNILVEELDGLIAFSPELADLNGPLAYLNDTAPPNGLLDASEFALIARVLSDPTIDLRASGGLWYAPVREAWQKNFLRTGVDCGVLLPSFIPGIRNLFAAYATMGDADSMAFYVALLMLGDIAAEDFIGINLNVVVPNPVDYTRLPQWLGLYGDADGDGATNREEYDYAVSLTVAPYILEAYATEGGTITPNGVFGKGAGENQVFEFTTEPDYRFAGIEVDGVLYPPVPQYLFMRSRVDYVRAALDPEIVPGGKGGAIPANHTVVAVFESTLVPEGEVPVDGEGAAEGEGEGVIEGEGVVEGLAEGELEGVLEGELGEGEGDGALEGEGGTEGEAPVFHTLDGDQSGVLDLVELLRAIQFYNAGAFGCDASNEEDGYGVGGGVTTECARHDADYIEPQWVLGLSELLRQVQIFNTGGYYACAGAGESDGYCAGTR